MRTLVRLLVLFNCLVGGVLLSDRVIAVPLTNTIGMVESGNHTNQLVLVHAHNTSESLGDLSKYPPVFPSCNNRDYYWAEQGGKDSVTQVSVKPDSMILQGERAVGQESGVHYLEGNVEAYKNDNTIVADWLFYNQPKAQATGGGNVVLSRQFDVIKGQWVDYYLDLDRGVMKNATATQYKTGMHATGDQISIIDKKHYQVDNAEMTSCDPNNPDWKIRSKQTNFDYQNSQGTARGAKFYVESQPVLYVPYFQFPLGERKSGFLSPDIGGNSNVGTLVGTPYYFNLAPNYDNTFEPKYYTNAGFQATDQFRYLTESGSGELYTEQMPNSYGGSALGYRYYYHLLDNHTLANSLTAGYEYNSVSDNNYFTDFGNFYSSVSNVNLSQSAYTTYKPQWGLFGVRVQNYQTLQPLGQPPTSPIYQTLPQVNFNVNPESIANSPVQVGLLSQYTNFAILNNALQTGQRSMVYPSLTMPLQNAWGFVKPKLGYSYTNYELDPYLGTNSQPTSINRGLPITSVDSGLIFDRPTTLASSNYVQTLEPRLYYLYIPEVDQGNIPTFDTATATYNLNQLFSENRFAGYDRINAANDLTMGVSSKLLNDNNGVQFADAGIGYRYYLTDPNYFLYGSYNQYQQLYQPRPNLISEVNNNWSHSITSNVDFQYDTYYNLIDAYALQMRYNPEDFKVLNARFSYQYNLPILYYAYVPGQPLNSTTFGGYENQYALDLSGQWPIYTNKWLLDARANYDFTRSLWLNYLGGLEYNGGCWAVKGIYGSYLANSVTPTSAWYLQFELKGLSSIGTDPTQYLNVSVPGYMPVQNEPGYAPITGLH